MRAGRAQLLADAVDDLAGRFSRQALLRHVLRSSLLLLECDAGSVCTVDEGGGIYRKEADIGVGCQSGKVFPLSEGITGAVVASGGPVLVDNYSAVRGGHLGAADRAVLRSAIGVPFIWRGRILGSCVVFGRASRRDLTDEDADLLERFARHVGVAIANAELHARAEASGRGWAAAKRGRVAAELRELVGELNELALYLEKVEGTPVSATSQAGRGTQLSLRTSEAHERIGPRVVAGPGNGLTPREAEVSRHLTLALTDREIATRLGISVKTVEKHVGAILRKAGARSRTELVARAGKLVDQEEGAAAP